jgi:organic hydroperoxide reductase OsmC/OhrA
LNEGKANRVVVCIEGSSHSIEIPPKQTGRGSSVNGGELLMAALATCYCNDIYREATKKKIDIESVEVEAEAEFEAEGEAARAVSYRARVKARASEDDIRAPHHAHR